MKIVKIYVLGNKFVVWYMFNKFCVYKFYVIYLLFK